MTVTLSDWEFLEDVGLWWRTAEGPGGQFRVTMYAQEAVICEGLHRGGNVIARAPKQAATDVGARDGATRVLVALASSSYEGEPQVGVMGPVDRGIRVDGRPSGETTIPLEHPPIVEPRDLCGGRDGRVCGACQNGVQKTCGDCARYTKTTAQYCEWTRTTVEPTSAACSPDFVERANIPAKLLQTIDLCDRLLGSTAMPVDEPRASGDHQDNLASIRRLLTDKSPEAQRREGIM